jgi:hypothetical protein
VGIASQLIGVANPPTVTVPPQSFIQLIYGESLQQGPNAKIGMAAVIRNRVNDSSFPTTYNGVVFQQNQFGAVGTTRFNRASSRQNTGLDINDYDLDVTIAADIFDQTQGDITGGSLYFISPTITEMQGVNEALATRCNGQFDPGEVDRDGDNQVDPDEDTGTTVFPASLAVTAQALFGTTNPTTWQVVVVGSVELNTRTDRPEYRGQPAFIFFRERQPTDPAVIRLPLEGCT